MQFVGEALAFYDPWEIGSLYASIAHRTGDSEAGGIGLHGGVGDKLGDDCVEAGIIAAGKYRGRMQPELSVFLTEERQPCVGASDVSGKNHFSKFLQWRPSRSSNSSESFGPQVPAA